MAQRAVTRAFPEELPAVRRGDHWWLEADGREVRLSNLEKVFWPVEGITKGDLIAYYYNISRFILPYLRDRPITMKRMPNGIEGGHFYQKDAPDNLPEWMTRCAIEPEDGKIDEMLLVQARPDLLFVANLGCVELHPLHSRCETYDRPDYMVFDLDPFEPAAFREALVVARHVKTALDYVGLQGVAKTSGATGVQVYIPVANSHTYDQTRELAERIGRMILKADPRLVTMEWEVRRRAGKVFIDHNMNRRAASLAAAYSLRPEPGATVSTPLRWDEVHEGEVRPQDFNMETIFPRLAKVGDLFERVLTEPQTLEGPLEKMGIRIRERDASDLSGGRLRRRLLPNPKKRRRQAG